MVTRRSVSKKIKKIVKRVAVALSTTDVVTTIHTMTDPGTLKRVIANISCGVDTFAADQATQWGFCITKGGEAVPSLANIESEETRWLVYGAGLSRAQTDPLIIALDSKIQRKTKPGDVLSFIALQGSAGYHVGSITIFIDQT